MKSIISDFRRGNATDRLAIASDLVSIAGISVAAVLAPAFAYRGQIDLEALAGKSFFALFGLAVFSLFFAGIITAHSWLTSALSKSAVGWLVVAAMWLMFSAVFVYAAYGFYMAVVYIHW